MIWPISKIVIIIIIIIVTKITIMIITICFSVTVKKQNAACTQFFIDKNHKNGL